MDLYEWWIRGRAGGEDSSGGIEVMWFEQREIKDAKEDECPVRGMLLDKGKRGWTRERDKGNETRQTARLSKFHRVGRLS